MRPIDADVLAEELWHIRWNLQMMDDTQTADKMMAGLRKAEEKMEAAPTIDPVKHGKWIEDAEEYYKAANKKGGGVDENTPYFTDDIACSECLSKFNVIDNETERFDFCPNCGARMVEGRRG